MPIVLPPVDPVHGMTHSEMIDHVSMELRNQNIDSDITRWLNMTLIEFAYIYVYGTLHENGSVMTEPGVPDVTLASNLLLLKTIGIPSQSQKLWPSNETDIALDNPDYRTLTGTTQEYYLNDIICGLFRVPTDVVQIVYTYQRQPVKLVELDTICDLPAAWHSAIVQRAITYGYSSEGNTDGVLRSTAIEKTLIARLKPVLYTRPDKPANLGVGRGSSKPLPPRLPPAFPKVN
jgi:hypothetical protein